MSAIHNFPRVGSILWILAKGEWRGMNVLQIAEKTGYGMDAVKSALYTLKAKYHIEIDYDSRPVREMEPVPDDLAHLSEHSALWRMIHEDWSEFTLAEAAKALHKNQQGLKTALAELERVHGITVPLKKEPPPQKMAEFKAQINRCKRCQKCVYWHSTFQCCDYLAMRNCRRPCPPGDRCTEFVQRRSKRGQSAKGAYHG